MNLPASKASSRQYPDETRWTHASKITLIAGVLFILLNIAQVVYGFTIPSLGWAGPDPESLDEAAPYFQLDVNAVSSPSLLQPGDLVYAVDDIPSETIVNWLSIKGPIPTGWEDGGEVNLTILRDGQTIRVDAPLVHWTISAWLRTNFGDFSELWDWFVTLLLFGTVTLTFLKRPGNLAARFLFAFGLSNLSITLGASIPDYVAQFLDPPALIAKVFFSNIVFAYLLAPSFLGFALSFPHPKTLIQHQPRLLLIPYLIGSITIVLLFGAPEYATIGFALTLGMLLVGVFALIHSGFKMRDAISRAQLRWAIGGVSAGVGLFLFNFASNQLPPYRDIILSIASLGQPVIGFSLAISILRYRLFDIDIIIRRTLQYAILTGLLALIYFGGIVILQGIMGPLTGEFNSPLITVISTLTIAALFNPLRHRTQDFIDRRFFRKKYDAEQTLAKFAATARDEVDMEKLTAALLDVVEETMQPEQVVLWLKQETKN